MEACLRAVKMADALDGNECLRHTRRRKPGNMPRKLQWMIGLIAYVLIASAALRAQAVVSLPIAPKIDQVLHVTTTQEFSVGMTGGAPGQIGEAQISTKSVLAYTQSNGRFDKDNRMEAQIAIERIESEQIVNGVRKPSDVSSLVGRTLTAVLDSAGKFVEIKVPDDLQAVSLMLKQLVGGTYSPLSVVPPMTMGIGETASLPSTIPMHMPGNSSTTPYETRTVITLRSIEPGDRGRIAHFDERIESLTQSDQLQLSGTGRLDMNIDRGFMTASATEWDFAAGFSPAAGAGAAQPMRATIKLTVAASE